LQEIHEGIYILAKYLGPFWVVNLPRRENL
jgi:hypothetical protein